MISIPYENLVKLVLHRWPKVFDPCPWFSCTSDFIKTIGPVRHINESYRNSGCCSEVFIWHGTFHRVPAEVVGSYSKGTQRTLEHSLTRKGERPLHRTGYDARKRSRSTLEYLRSTPDPLDPKEQVSKPEHYGALQGSGGSL
jgi:hypothetical protein